MGMETLSQNTSLWFKSKEARRGVAEGFRPELTEEFSQVSAIYKRFAVSRLFPAAQPLPYDCL